MTYNWDRLPNESDEEYEARALLQIAAWQNETGLPLIASVTIPRKIGAITPIRFSRGGMITTQRFIVTRNASRQEYESGLKSRGLEPTARVNGERFYYEVMAD